MTYERTVAAAVAETKSKFALAEALALDIPPRRGRTAEGEVSTRQYLVEARDAIIEAGGEPRAPETMRQYRVTATWVMDPGTGSFRWLPGVSFTAHSEANQVGLTYEEFVNLNVKTADDVRRHAGQPLAASTPKRALESWSSEQKVKAARDLLSDPEVVGQVVSDKETRATVGQATDEYYRQQAKQRAERTERMAAEDQTDRRIDSALWVNRLGEAHERYAREVNEALRHVGELPETERYWLTGAVDRAESSMRATRRYLELGKSEFDAELEDLLQNGA